jgi:hypothetical protein
MKMESLARLGLSSSWSSSLSQARVPGEASSSPIPYREGPLEY